jgi:hypothetical protein
MYYKTIVQTLNYRNYVKKPKTSKRIILNNYKTDYYYA